MNIQQRICNIWFILEKLLDILDWFFLWWSSSQKSSNTKKSGCSTLVGCTFFYKFIQIWVKIIYFSQTRQIAQWGYFDDMKNDKNQFNKLCFENNTKNTNSVWRIE